MLADFVQDMIAQGHVSFSVKDVQKSKMSSPEAVQAALRRLQKKGGIAMPYRGFYVIVPPEYRTAGCLPPEQFIPDLMAHLRKSNTMSQEKLAEQSNLDRSFISQIECGRKQPSLITIYQFAKTFKISASKLLALTEEKIKK